ncbi:tautomerase family protein [Rhodovulum sp. YNF3179]|uniref:tautomerase family protein n=1 Tax=Rhodovulum sp. YNF3179 TaxID=3425127 RepID=UPI003D33C062
MPVVTIDLIAGYDADTRGRLGRAVTDAVASVVAAPPEAITVMLTEHAGENYMRGGAHRRPGPPRPDPAELVRGFLGAMEARDLDTARAMLATGFRMTFPGDVRMSRLEELIEWARPRYKAVQKTYERFDAAQSGATAIVYCFGTLSGTWLDGTGFSGIRFIDRFEIEAGKITRQDVWNDMGETRGRT